VTAGGRGADGNGKIAAMRQHSYERPSFTAILEAQPLPVLIFGPDGSVARNEAAAHLVSVAPGGAERALAQDGTDLWTIISARSDEANPFFDVRVRIRTSDGQAPETTMTIVPVRGSGGLLAGAVAFILTVPTERLRGAATGVGLVSSDDFADIVGRLGKMVGATRTYVLEVDLDFAAEARVLASWTSDGTEMPKTPFSLRGTPADTFGGRRLVCIPAGVAETYPEDPTLCGGEFEAYVGVALSSESGTQVGVLGGLWREPLIDVPAVCAVFSIIAAQAAHALSDLIAKRELRESEQRYGSVFEGSAVPIVLIEPHTTQIVDANPAACRMYGYPRDEFVTMSVLQIDALAAETVQAELKRALEGSRSNFIGRHMLSDGSIRDVEVSIGPIIVGGRALLYSMMNDITDRKRMEAELERSRRNLELIVAQRTEDLLRANTELQQASTARDMVFVNLAQELRTSLQTITGFSDLLAGGMAGSLSEEQRRQVEMIQQAGKRLATFATSLIETQRVESSGLALDCEEVDLVSLAESVLFGLASFAEDKGLTLTLHEGERPVNVETDRYKLQQIMLNLLSNAIRYTERGGVTVTVAIDADGLAAVAVADTGPGLPPEKLRTIFDGPEVHDSAAGIGLPASSRIAKLLGGSIEVQSDLTRGSVFTLRLPVKCGSPRAEAVDSADE